MITRASQLRLLIENDLRRCDEIAAGFESMLDGDTEGEAALVAIATRASATLKDHQRQLNELLFPAATAQLKGLAGSLVTNTAAQPGIL